MTAYVQRLLCVALMVTAAATSAPSLSQQPLIDTHIHYSHDAWTRLPPERAISVLREAGLERAFVSSSSDDGTQKLYALAPELIVPVLRPYRKRGEISTWMQDPTVIDMLEDRLARYTYAGIGEFHAFGADVELPVLQRVIELAHEHRLFLHAHSDAEAIDRIFARDPQARVLWAHSGFDPPDVIREMLNKHARLWSDLAFRSEHARQGRVETEWRELFIEFPDRFTIGTDSYTPERWYYVVEHANWTRAWLADLPPDVARGIAFANAQRLVDWTMGR